MSDNAWLEVRLSCPDSQRARRLARRLKRGGARRLMQRGLELWSVWPDDQASRQTLAWLAELDPPASLRVFRAAEPLAAWAAPQARPMGPGLALAGADSGLRAGPGLLIIDALTAFGAGDHPSTALNLELLCRLLAGQFGPPPPAGAWAADIGAGTGVLALAMALVGGLSVLAVDPEPAARRACLRNIALNPLAGGRVHFVQARGDAVGGRFAVVAANLPTGLLLAIGDQIAALVADGGFVALSGFRDEAAESIAQIFTSAGLKPIATPSRHGWSGLLLSRQ